MKRYQTYKDSGVEWIGEIPAHWKILPIRALCHLGRGRVISNEEIARNPGEYPVYSSQTANNGEMGRINSYDFDGEYVTWTTDGANAGTVFYRYGKFNCTNVCGTLKSKNKLRMPLLPYILNLGTRYYVRYDINPKLMNNMIAKIKISVPPYLEQATIAAHLDRQTAQIDNLISKKQKLIELLKEERSAIINQAVTKGLNPDAPMKDSGIEWQGEVPEHWEVKRLKYFFTLITEKNCSLQTKKVALENIESWTGRFIDSEVDYQGEGISFLKGDVLFGKLRPYLAKVLNAKFSGASVGDIFVMRPKLGISSRFAFYRFLSKPFIDIVNGSTFGAKMPRVSWDFIANLHIAMPNNKEQRTISGYLDSKTIKIDQTISRIEKQTALLQEFRTALISEVVTGKIDVRDGGSNG